MNRMDCKRTPDELIRRATMWWPSFLAEQEALSSIIPGLLQSQDQFLSILTLARDNPGQVFQVIAASGFPPNLFLKHLVVLADFGGETIQRVNVQFYSLFPRDEAIAQNRFDFVWNEKEYSYSFAAMPAKGSLNNRRLQIDAGGLLRVSTLDGLTKDMIMLLLHGASSTNELAAAVFHKCEIGSLLGRGEELEKYVKQKYIWVSRITGGAQANALGQVAQTYLHEFLRANLGASYEVVRNGHIEGITQNDGRTLISFDLVVGKGERKVAIEVTFQVTTNSTIERKSGQAASRYRALKERGHYIAYVVDGAGNFQRRSAISTLCANSDCTVAYTDDEFAVLAQFIRSVLG